MRYDVPHDRAALEYQYLSVCFMWRRPDRELHVYFQWSLEREFMYFAGKLVYLIVLPSNQLAINSYARNLNILPQNDRFSHSFSFES